MRTLYTKQQKMCRRGRLIFNSIIQCFIVVAYCESTPCPSLCTCRGNEASCQDQPLLNYIPAFPSSIERLLFAGNNIPELNKTTFLNLTQLHLKSLKLRHNNSSRMAADSLSSLFHLEHLDLSGNGFINKTEIANCIAGLQSPNFSSIYLNSFVWTKEPKVIYQALKSFNIKGLKMNQNFFKHINLTNLGQMFPNLTYLSAAYNNIENVTAGKMSRLKNLQLHHNYIDIDGMFGSPGNCFFPELKILNLTSNFVNYFEKKFLCLESLETLILDKNPVKQIKTDTFVNLTSLNELHLNHLGDRLFNIQGYAFRSASLRVMSFSQNHFYFTSDSRHTIFNTTHIFDGVPYLEELDLSDNYFNISDGCLTKMLSGLRNLTKLTLKSCAFRTIPPKIFEHMQKIQVLILTRNHISEWNGTEVFGNLTSLQVLMLNHNYINVLNESSFPKSLLANLTSLNLARNPFYCGCTNLWFRRWINEREAIFSEYPNEYFCVNPPELHDTRLKDYFSSEMECNPHNTFIQVISVLSLIGIFTVIMVSLIYKGRWHIRYWIYLHRAGKRKMCSIRSGDNFLYSGFVVYSDDDRAWVINTFLNTVENDHGHKLCIHHRDFVVGKLIVDNIAESISLSKKVILVMSRSMITSDWCLFETRLAQRKFLNEEAGSLIIIMLEYISKHDMPHSLKNLVEMTTYIMWPDEPYLQDRFWRTLLQALGNPD